MHTINRIILYHDVMRIHMYTAFVQDYLDRKIGMMSEIQLSANKIKKLKRKNEQILAENSRLTIELARLKVTLACVCKLLYVWEGLFYVQYVYVWI